MKKVARLLARVLITGGLLYWVFQYVDGESFWQAVRSTQWSYLVGVWLLTVVFTLVQLAALQIIFRKQDCQIRMGLLFGASAVSSLYTMILPGILSTGVKWYILRKGTGKGSVVFGGMLYNQIALLVVTIVLGLASLLRINPALVTAVEGRRPWVLQAVVAGLLVLTLGLSALALNERTSRFIVRVFNPLLNLAPGWVRRNGQELLRQIGVFQNAGWMFHLKIALINVVDMLFIGVLIYLLAAKAARISVPLELLIGLNAGLFVLSRLPVTIANLGVREWTLVGILGLYGVEKSSALVMSMILFSSMIFMALIGAGYQVGWTLRDRHIPPPIPDAHTKDR